MIRGLRLAAGTLTALPVPFAGELDRRTARWAMLLAPLAVLPLGVLAALVVWLGDRLELPGLAVGLLVVGALALGSRALHLDGLSDVADGLTASYDAERSLAVMRTGASGPAGTAALVVVLGLQAAAVSGIYRHPHAPVVVGTLVCLSRAALALTCVRGVPGARTDGIGGPFAGVVPRTAALAWGVVVAVVLEASRRWTVASHVDGEAYGVLTALLALVVLALLLRRAVRRLGGVTGDVYGAAIEVTLAVLLLGLSAG